MARIDVGAKTHARQCSGLARADVTLQLRHHPFREVVRLDSILDDELVRRAAASVTRRRHGVAGVNDRDGVSGSTTFFSLIAPPFCSCATSRHAEVRQEEPTAVLTDDGTAAPSKGAAANNRLKRCFTLA